MNEIKSAVKHKMLFVGVTTTKSIINHVFPAWMEILGSDLQLEGVDIPARDEYEPVDSYATIYRECIKKIKFTPEILGALVTTHKIDLYSTTKDLFDELTNSSDRFGEIGCIYKSNSKLVGEATDILTAKRAFENICVAHQGAPKTKSDVCILGCGGAGIALSYVLLANNDQFTGKIIMTDISDARSKNAKNLLSKYDSNHRLNIYTIQNTNETDKIINSMSTGSFVINATGLGKDKPGSPISHNTIFPNNGCVWEYNYRGELDFYKLAIAQKREQNLSIFDGFDYFLYGWATVISRILGIHINDEIFARLSKVATEIYLSERFACTV